MTVAEAGASALASPLISARVCAALSAGVSRPEAVEQLEQCAHPIIELIERTR
jgi:hypothetical protein